MFMYNLLFEVVWIIVLIVILVFIGVFLFLVLFNQQEILEGDVIIKVIGYQWYWGYEYVDDGVVFDSYMLGYLVIIIVDVILFVLDEVNEQLLVDYGYDCGQWLLVIDIVVVVFVGVIVVMQVIVVDVIYLWIIFVFGVKQDVVFGCLVELWFEVE